MGKAPGIKTHASDCWNTIGVWSNKADKCEKLIKHIHCRNCPVFTDMGRSVFEHSAPSGYLPQWRKKIASLPDVKNKKAESILVFRVQNEWFAFPSTVLSGIENERTIHRIPRNSNRFISGVVNINGEICVCYSLINILNINVANSEKNSDVKKPKRLIVVELNGLDYVFLVDEVTGIHWFGELDLRTVPSTLDEEFSRLLVGVINQKNKKVALFDIDKMREKLEMVSL